MGLGLVGLFLLFGTVPGLGKAQDAGDGPSPQMPVGFTVKTSNGYSMLVVGLPAKMEQEASVIVNVTRGQAGAFYVAPATVADSSLIADLGDLGEISVQFNPSGELRTERPRCGGESVPFDSGYWEGRIEFHGEEGYTQVQATKASGSLQFVLDLLCPGISGGNGKLLPGAELDVEVRRARSAARLKVVKNAPERPAHFEASAYEVHNGIAIDRFTNLIAGADTFRYDPLLRTAVLRPPRPFSGSAQYRRPAKAANRWTGDLSLDFPGKSNVRLNASGFKVRLVHARWTWKPSTLERRLLLPLSHPGLTQGPAALAAARNSS